jgi:hypothetical protein
MPITLNGTTGITTPGLINTGSTTFVDLTTTGNTILGDQSTDTLNVANGNLVLNSSGNLLLAGAGSRQRITVGTTTVSSTASPEAIDLGATFSSAAGQNLKIYTFNDGTTKHGIGVSTGSSDYVTPTGGAHTFYVNTSAVMTLNASGNLGIGDTSPPAPGGADARVISLKGNRYPQFIYTATSAAANSTTWRTIARDTLLFQIQTLNDAFSTEQTAYEILRTTGSNSIDIQRWYTATSERMRLDNSGNLGIGTTTTSGVSGAKLYVNGGITMPGNNDISGTSGLSPHYGSGSFTIYSGMPGAGTERARIDSSGNFTLGFAASPYNSAKMEIYRASAGDALILTSPVGTGNSNAIAWSNSRGDVVSARIYNIDDNAYGASIVFANRTGQGTTTTERARIDSSGNFMVGTTTAISKMTLAGGKFVINSTDSGYGQMQIGNTSSGGEASIAFVSGATGFNDPTSVNGNTYVWAIGANVYGIGGNNWGIGNKSAGNYIAKIAFNSTSWTFSSDERLKDLDGEIENAVEKVTGLRAVYYTWKSDESKTRKVGLIAQDVLAVLPEAVDKPEQDTKENGDPNYLGLGMSDVVPLLVAAIKELKAELDSVKSELATIKGAA